MIFWLAVLTITVLVALWVSMLRIGVRFSAFGKACDDATNALRNHDWDALDAAHTRMLENAHDEHSRTMIRGFQRDVVQLRTIPHP